MIIEKDARPVAIIHAAEPERRTISESIAIAKAHAEKLGYSPTIGPDFAADVEAAVNSHRESLDPGIQHCAQKLSPVQNAVREMLNFVAENKTRLEGVSVKQLIHEM